MLVAGPWALSSAAPGWLKTWLRDRSSHRFRIVQRWLPAQDGRKAQGPEPLGFGALLESSGDVLLSHTQRVQYHRLWRA